MDAQNTTILMIDPTRAISGEKLQRWNFLRAAIEKAGIPVRIDEGRYHSIYARDPAVIVGRYAFYGITALWNKPKPPFKDTLKEFGYQPVRVSVDHAYVQGGNFVDDGARNLLFYGVTQIDMEPEHRPQLDRAAIKIADRTKRKAHAIEMSSLHLDCALGILPNGKLLVKLADCRPSLKLKMICTRHDYFLATAGILPNGFNTLVRAVGRDNILTWSIKPHPHADIVTGSWDINNHVRARSMGMLCNFITIGKTMIGEDMPKSLRQELTAAGFQLVTPKDYKIPAFMTQDHDFVGAAHCLTLPLTKPALSL